MDVGGKSRINAPRSDVGRARGVLTFLRETLRANASVSISIEHSLGLLIGYAALGAVVARYVIGG